MLRPLAQLPAIAAVRRHLDIDPAKRRALARQSLLLQFESLGENCELAFVQDHLDAHPIGLFRWSGIAADDLCTALETDLEGVGDPSNMTVQADPRDGEYHVRDVRYGMDTHTGMFEGRCSPDEVLTVFGRRMRRLSEKLLEDVEEGHKVFVFQTRQPLTSAQRDRLSAALRRHGPRAVLFYVEPAPIPERVGEVRQIRPGLIVGYLDHARETAGGWRIPYQLWLSVLAKAARLSGRRFARAATDSLAPLNLPEVF